MKRYMIIETFRPGCKAAVYERLGREGRLMPDGLAYLNSWLEKDGDRCFQLVEATNSSLIDEWIERWTDLVSFEVIQIGDKPDGSNSRS